MHNSDTIECMIERRAFFIQKKVSSELGAFLDDIAFGAEMVVHGILMSKICNDQDEKQKEKCIFSFRPSVETIPFFSWLKRVHSSSMLISWLFSSRTSKHPRPKARKKASYGANINVFLASSTSITSSTIWRSSSLSTSGTLEKK